MSGSCYHYDAEGHERALCELLVFLIYTSPPKADMTDITTSGKVPQAAFADAAKTMKRQITPSVLDRFAQWRDANERR